VARKRVLTDTSELVILRRAAPGQHWRIHGEAELAATERICARAWVRNAMPMPVHDPPNAYRNYDWFLA
jgi:hypothetical protein